MRNFYEDLNNSNNCSLMLDNAYFNIFNCTRIKTITDIVDQKLGIDKQIFVKGTVINIEEKIRGADYGDILLELLSNVQAGTIGRTIDRTKQSDYISYYLSSTKRLFIINYKQLREATINNLEEWKKRFKPKDARTIVGDNYYTTRNIAVPLKVLKEAGVEFKFYKL